MTQLSIHDELDRVHKEGGLLDKVKLPPSKPLVFTVIPSTAAVFNHTTAKGRARRS